jgi:hypothetical protein
MPFIDRVAFCIPTLRMFEYISAPEAAKNGVFRKGGYRSHVRMGAVMYQFTFSAFFISICIFAGIMLHDSRTLRSGASNYYRHNCLSCIQGVNTGKAARNKVRGIWRRNKVVLYAKRFYPIPCLEPHFSLYGYL